MSAVSSTNPVPVDPEERRVRDRYTCDLKTSCKPVDCQSATPWPAKVRDISATGVRLTMFRRFEPGTLLALEVQDTSGLARMLLARVVRVAKMVRGRWILGCAFDTELHDQQLEALVETPYTAWIQEQTPTTPEPVPAEPVASVVDAIQCSGPANEICEVVDVSARSLQPVHGDTELAVSVDPICETVTVENSPTLSIEK